MIAFDCAVRLVEDMGQPMPAPFRFWIVTAAALRRAFWDAMLLSVGNDRRTVGLRTTCPARMFTVRFYMDKPRLRNG